MKASAELLQLGLLVARRRIERVNCSICDEQSRRGMMAIVARFAPEKCPAYGLRNS